MSGVPPVLASVIVVSVQDYSRLAVLAQAELRTRIEDLLRAALRPVPPALRVVLDAPQGMAVALLDRPRAALDFAERVQAGASGLPLCIGINHGPVAIAEDANRGKALIGDGITAGMAMAQAAAPGRVIASRAFRDALDSDSPERAARLGPAGVHTDAQVRTHELFTPDPRAAGARRWRLAYAGIAVCTGILALGAVARMALFGSGLRSAPAVIEFEITPRGDIYIDGALKGSSPPLTRIEITPGRHLVEVRSGQHPPLQMEVTPGPAEELTIAHAFVDARAAGKTRQKPAGTAKPREKTLSETARDEWRTFRRSIGF